MSATLLPFPRAVFYDANGNPLAAGFVWTYVPNTTTPKTSWQDAGESIPNQNPILLDANGSCLLYGAGQYTLAVLDAIGNQVPAYSGLTTDAAAGLTAFKADLASQTDATKGSALVGYFQAISGWIGRTLKAKLLDYLTVLDFGADPTGVNDNTATWQAAINYAASVGGACIWVTPGTYKFTGTLNIVNSGVVLRGTSQFGCVLNFNNATADCIVVGFQASTVFGVEIVDLTINGVAKTAGRIISAKTIGNCIFSGIITNTAFDGIYVEEINNVLIANAVIILSVAGANFGLKWFSTASAAKTSNVLTLENVTIQCSATGANGIVVDGSCQTLRMNSVGVIHANDGLQILNTQASNSFFPQFFFCNDLEIDGVLSHAMLVEGGRHLRFVNCDFFNNFSGGGSDTNCIHILADGLASVTTAMWFTACRISGAQQSGIYCEAKNVDISACYIGDNSLSGLGVYPGIALGNSALPNGAATSITVSAGQNGAIFGDIGRQNYGITAVAGVTRVTVDGVDFSNCVTGAILDNTGGLGNVMWHGCIDINGVQLPDRLPILPADSALATEGIIYENATTHALRVYVNGALKTITVT